MSEPAAVPQQFSSKARVHEQLMGIMVLLSEAPDGLQVQSLLKSLREAVPPTESELTTNASGLVRYDTNARWWSVNLVKAGWITKQNGVWRITELGRQALLDYPTPGELGQESDRLYTEWSKQDKAAKEKQGTWFLTDSVVARIPAGRWVGFTDLADAVGRGSKSIGVHLWSDQPHGWHRVARMDGSLSSEKWGDEDRAEEQRRLLLDDGMDGLEQLPGDRRMSVAELLSIAGDVRGGERAWLVRGTSVKGASLVSEWLADGYVSVPGSMLPLLPVDADDAAVKDAVEAGYGTLGYSQKEAKVEEIRAFVRRMKPGHLLLTTSGEDVFVGVVAGEFVQDDSPGRRSNLRRPIVWENADNPAAVSGLSSRLAGRLRATGDVVELTDIFDDVKALFTPESVEEAVAEELAVPSVTLSLLDDETVDRLLIGRPWLDELVELVADRHQVIVYGPPGTGKTFLAQEVAEALAGQGRVTLVQFHPSYAYEDFFEGYRPSGTDGGGISLQLVPGPFRKVVDAARANPGEAYFLIVDEINRANLAKVFGELYFLLEYRDRSIDLLYSSGDTGPAFTLPGNVYLIGTMNTADRSIALVDAAMRRRFAFLSLHPEDQQLDRVLRAWLAELHMPADRVDLAVAVLVELNKRIGDKDVKIGPSYLMSKSVATDKGLDRIWRTSILPLLEEYHVGEGVDVEAKYGLAALRKSIGLPVTEPMVEVALDSVDEPVDDTGEERG